MMFFELRRRLKIAEETLEIARCDAEAWRKASAQYKAQMFDAWKVIRGQNKGLQRQRRLIRRLQTEIKLFEAGLVRAASDPARSASPATAASHPPGAPGDTPDTAD